MRLTSIYAIIILVCVTSSCANTSKGSQSNNEQLIKDYYNAYVKKDWTIMDRILAGQFTFSSPAGDDHISLRVYKERCWPNSEKTKKFDIERMIVSGDAAFVTYTGWTTSDKPFRNTEYFKFKGGKIVENECFFGTGVNFPNNE